MLRVGLTGGYATGKSFVARELARLGCLVIYADDLGHLVLEPNGEAYADTVAAFGEGILEPDRTINRKRLGEVVFGSPELLEKLSSFVHPAVIALEERTVRDFQAREPDGIAVVEAAILIETGRYTVFDCIILTVCDEATAIERGMRRDGLTREHVLARLEKQLPVDEKKKHAQYVIDTSGPKEETLLRVDQVYSELKAMAGDKRR